MPANVHVVAGNGAPARAEVPVPPEPERPPVEQPAPVPVPDPPPAPAPEEDPPAVRAQFAPPAPADPADELADSLAGKLRALVERSRTGEQDFSIPGFGGQLILVARAVKDAGQLQAGMSPAAFVAHCTVRVVLIEDDGSRTDLGVWGPKIAELLGRQDVLSSRTPSSDLVRFVFDNEWRLDQFAKALLAWMGGEQLEAEQQAGE